MLVKVAVAVFVKTSQQFVQGTSVQDGIVAVGGTGGEREQATRTGGIGLHTMVARGRMRGWHELGQ